MTALVRPDVRFHASWAAAVTEFGELGVNGSDLWAVVDCGTSVEALAGYLPQLWAGDDPRVERPAGRVPWTSYWIVDGEEFVGYLSFRHELNEQLLREGGHIGYSVRPSRRRQGHASRALALALDAARDLGLDRILVTCDDENEASARTIEANGGVLENLIDGKRRYWIKL